MSNASTEENGPLLLSIGTVAQTLGLSKYQVRGLIVAGHLSTTRVGHRDYIPAGAVRDYVTDIAKSA